MTRNSAPRRLGRPRGWIAAGAALVLGLAAGSGCGLTAHSRCYQCPADAGPEYCAPQGECFGYYATYWRRWPGDCHLWHPEMLPLVVEPVSAQSPTIVEEMPLGAPATGPTPAPAPPIAPPTPPAQPPAVIIEPKGAANAPQRTMQAPPVELGPDTLGRGRATPPPSGGVIPVRYPSADLRRLDAERLARIGTTVR
jgi:hypothetical protein